MFDLRHNRIQRIQFLITIAKRRRRTGKNFPCFSAGFLSWFSLDTMWRTTFLLTFLAGLAGARASTERTIGEQHAKQAGLFVTWLRPRICQLQPDTRTGCEGPPARARL